MIRPTIKASEGQFVWPVLGEGQFVWPVLGEGQFVWPVLGEGQFVWPVLGEGWSRKPGNSFRELNSCSESLK